MRSSSKLLDEKITLLLTRFAENEKTLVSAKDAIVSALESSDELMKDVHSIRSRVKTVASMSDKLARKRAKASRVRSKFDIDQENFYKKITDAIGIRLIHKSHAEFPSIHTSVINVLETNSFEFLERPKAWTWDPKYAESFRKVGLLDVIQNARYYTSVHYVFAQPSNVSWSAEIQVRTLGEELWGEVDHKFNYPNPHAKEVCREQIVTLARQIGACSSLVDSIYSESLR